MAKARKQEKAGLISVKLVATYVARVCSKCQVAYGADDKFCPKCGKKLANCHVPKCECGARMAPFCANCGKRDK